MNNIFINLENNSKNTYYLPLTAMLFTCSLLLNFSNMLMYCSLCFVLLAFSANLIAELYGKKKAIATVALCSILTLIVSFKIFDLLLVGSFIAVFTAFSASIHISAKFTTISFQARNFITLSIAAVIDSIIAASCLLSRFSVDKILLIGFKDLMFKFSYISVMTICLIAATYLFSYLSSTLRYIYHPSNKKLSKSDSSKK